MQKVKEILLLIGRYLKTRGAAFYLLILTTITSIIIPFIYYTEFGKSYYSVAAFVLPFMAVPLLVSTFFKPAARYSAAAMYVLEFISLLVFISATYMHLTTAFFNGIEGNIFEQAGFGFSFCTVTYLINMLLSAAAVFFKQFNTGKTTAESIYPQEVSV